jgi:hypothetical protein
LCQESGADFFGTAGDENPPNIIFIDSTKYVNIYTRRAATVIY